MEIWVKVIIIFAIVFILKELLELKNRKEQGKAPYIKRDLLSKAEKNFYDILKRSILDTNTIFIKVRLWDIIDVPRYVKNRVKHTNKIKSKHIDFLICDEELKSVLAIELDDKSHTMQNRIDRDDFINDALVAAGIKILHIKVKKEYEVEILKKQIENALNPEEELIK